MGMPVEPIWDQQDYAFYQSNGTTIIGSAGTQQTLDVDTTYYVRLAIGDTNGTNQVSQDLTCNFQYNLAGGGWNDVTTTTPLQFANGSLTDGGSITSSTLTATGTFNNGRVYESDSDATVVYTLPTDESATYTEVMLGFTIDSAQVTNGQEILVRATFNGGTAYDNYTNADIDVSESTAYTLDADTHALSVSATAVDLNRGYKLAADTHSFAVTNSDVSLTRGAILDADTHAFSVTTPDVGLNAALTIDADTHSFSLSTFDASLEKGKTRNADTISFGVTARDIELNRGYSLSADTHTYNITTTDVGLNASLNLSADTHSYSVTASDVSLEKGKTLDADTHSYGITTSDVTLTYTPAGGTNYDLDADIIAFALSPSDVSLDYVTEEEILAGAGHPVYEEEPRKRKKLIRRIKRVIKQPEEPEEPEIVIEPAEVDTDRLEKIAQIQDELGQIHAKLQRIEKSKANKRKAQAEVLARQEELERQEEARKLEELARIEAALKKERDEVALIMILANVA